MAENTNKPDEQLQSSRGVRDYDYQLTGHQFTPTKSTAAGQKEESQEPELPEWMQWLEGIPVLGEVVDFVGDAYTVLKSGRYRAHLADLTAPILGDYATEEDIERYTKAVKGAENMPEPDEMLGFNRIMQEEGGGAWAVMKALAAYPSVAPLIMLQSFASMTSESALVSAGGVGAATAATPFTAPFALPAALGTASATTDALLTTTDFIREYLAENNMEFTKENVHALLNNKDAIGRIRTRAKARGAAIGIVDAFTLSAGKIIGAGVRAASGSRALAAGVGALTEATGGSIGEFAGQIAGGQEINSGEILLEGIAELGGPGTLAIAAQTGQEVVGGRSDIKAQQYSGSAVDISSLPTVAQNSAAELQGVLGLNEQQYESLLPVFQKLQSNMTNMITEDGDTDVTMTAEELQLKVPEIAASVAQQMMENGTVPAGVDPKQLTEHLQNFMQGTIVEINGSGKEVFHSAKPSEFVEDLPDLVDLAIDDAVKDKAIDPNGVLAQNQDVIVEAIENEINNAEQNSPEGTHPVPRIDHIIQNVTERLAEDGITVPGIDNDQIQPLIKAIGEHVINRIVPNGAVKVTPWNYAVMEQAYAAENSAFPGQGVYNIGPNLEPSSKDNLISWVNSASPQELLSTPIQITNDDSYLAFVQEKKERASIDLQTPQDTPSRDKVMDLEYQANHQSTDSIPGKLRKAELDKRAKNLSLGKPEMDGIEGSAFPPKKATDDSKKGLTKSKRQVAEERLEDTTSELVNLGQLHHEGKITQEEFRRRQNELLTSRKAQDNILNDKRGRPRKTVDNTEPTAQGFKARAKSGERLNEVVLEILDAPKSGLNQKQKQAAIKHALGEEVTIYQTISTNAPGSVLGKVIKKQALAGSYTLIPEELPNSIVVKATIKVADLTRFKRIGKVAVTNVSNAKLLSNMEFLQVDTTLAKAKVYSTKLKDLSTTEDAKFIESLFAQEALIDSHFYDNFGKGQRVSTAPNINALIKKNKSTLKLYKLIDFAPQAKLLSERMNDIAGKEVKGQAEVGHYSTLAYESLIEDGKKLAPLTVLQKAMKYGVANEAIVEFGDGNYAVIDADGIPQTMLVDGDISGYTFETWTEEIAEKDGAPIPRYTGTREFWAPRHAAAKLRLDEDQYSELHGEKPISTEQLNNLVAKRNAQLGKQREISLEARSMNAYKQDFVDLLENPEMLIMYPQFAYEVYEKVSRNPEFNSAFPEQANLEREAAETWIQRIFDPGRRGQNSNRLDRLQQFWNEETGLGRALTWNNSYLQSMEEILINNSDIGVERVNFQAEEGATTYGSYSFPIDGKRGVIAPQLSLNDTDQKPDTISHELAHAWHQVTMYDRPKLAAKVKELTLNSYGPRILEQAMDGGLYTIITLDGRTDEAFAMMMGREVTRLLFNNSPNALENKTSVKEQMFKLNELLDEVQGWTVDDIKTIQDLAKVVAVETYLGDTVIFQKYEMVSGEIVDLGFDFSADNRSEAGGYAYNKLIKRNVRKRNTQQIYGQEQTEKTSLELPYKERFEAWYKEDLVEDFKAEVEAGYGHRAELKAAIGEKDYWGMHLGTLDKTFDSILEEIGPAQTKRLLVAVYQRDMWSGFEKDIIMNMFKKLQHVEMEKTPVDQDFDALVKQLATPDGNIVVSRVVMIDEEFDSVDFADVGSSWSVDPTFPDYWIDAQNRAGAQGYTPYVFYTTVNINDPNVIPVGQYEGTTQSEIIITDPSVLKEMDWDVRDPKKTWKVVESHSTRPVAVESKGVIDRGFLERAIKQHNTKKQKKAELAIDPRSQEQRVKDLDKAKLDVLEVVETVQEKYAKSNSQRKREISNLPAAEVVENVAKAFQKIGDFDMLASSLERLGRYVLPTTDIDVDAIEVDIDTEEGVNASEDANLEARKEQLRRNLSAGWQVYQGLEAKGYVGMDVGWKGNDPFTVTILNDKVMGDLVKSAGLETSEKGSWTEVQFEKPAPYTEFKHESGLPLISNADKTARQQPQQVLDVANTAQEIPYSTHGDLLDVYLNLDAAGLLAIEEEGVDLDALTPSARREHLKALDSKILEYQFILFAAKQARDAGVPFYTQARFDFRGRLYSTPSYFNYQGSKLALSLYQFANKEAIGESGWKWMLIQAADTEGSRYDADGNELTLLDQRYKFAESKLDEWLKIANNPNTPENRKIWQSVDEPYLFLATIMEIKAAVESGNPFAYKSGLPIHMDATNSGGQVLVALMKDLKGAKVANLIPDNQRGDLYNKVGQGVISKLPEVTDANRATLEEVQTELRNHWDAIENAKNKDANKAAFAAYVEYKRANKDKVKLANELFWSQPAMRENIRKIVKGPVMTKYYSAGVDTMAEQVLKKFKSKYPYLTIDQAKFLASQLEKEANKIMPGPAELMRLFQTLAARQAKVGNPITAYGTYSGFKMVQNPRTQEQIKQKFPYDGNNEKIRARSTNGVISVAMRVGNTGLDAKKAKSSIAPNMVHMMDSQIVHWLLLNAGYDIQTIHDSFGASPANAEQLYADIRTAFVEIFEGDVLPNLIAMMLNDGVIDDAALDAANAQIGKMKNYNTGLDLGGKHYPNEFAFSAGKGFVTPKELTVLQKYKKEESFKNRALMDSRLTMEQDIMERTKPCRI